MPERNLPHLVLPVSDTASIPYSRGKTPFKKNYLLPERQDRASHGSKLAENLQNITPQMGVEKVFAITFKGQVNKDLIYESLDRARDYMELLSVTEKDNIVFANVRINSVRSIPKIKKMLTDYPASKDGTSVANLLDSIEEITECKIETFFTDDPAILPTDFQQHWWEVWLTSKDALDTNALKERFIRRCRTNNITLNETPIEFEDRIIFLCQAVREQLSNYIPKCNDLIAEIRLARKLNIPIPDLEFEQQLNILDELREKTIFPAVNSYRMVILDGNFIVSKHPLIEGAFIRNQKALDRFSDNLENAHATEVSSLSLFGDLEKAIFKPVIQLTHKVECVQVFDETGNDVGDYGLIAEKAIQITNESPNNAYITTVTEKGEHFGKPTLSSGYLDLLIYRHKKLFMASIGNFKSNTALKADDYRTQQIESCVESPSHAWNALSVGAYTELTDANLCSEEGVVPFADSGDLSPYSRTSKQFDTKWPIKPEVVFEGGNAVRDHDDTIWTDLNFAPTVCSPNFIRGQNFSKINATSAAAGFAGNFVGELTADYPHFWPETIRGLVVHSAEWTETMKVRLRNQNTQENKTDLARICGYGVPNLEKARHSASNALSIIIQKEFNVYDYKKDENGVIPTVKIGPKKGQYKNDKQAQVLFFKLPWPKELLSRDLAAQRIKIKVTLSYFMDVRPGERGYSGKYKYPSHNLRFDLQAPLEEDIKFKRRINALARSDDDEANYNDDNTWYFGKTSKMRTGGSIHKDIMEVIGADLATMTHVAVYPANGWWKDSAKIRPEDTNTRFSLIIEIDAGETDVNLYNPININIQNMILVQN